MPEPFLKRLAEFSRTQSSHTVPRCLHWMKLDPVLLVGFQSRVSLNCPDQPVAWASQAVHQKLLLVHVDGLHVFLRSMRGSARP